MNDMTGCRKFEKSMFDAALGALPPLRERELFAHVGECDACRAAYRQNRELAAGIDRGLQSLVSGQPSPQFAVRLRARLAEKHAAPRFRWLAWKPVLAGAAVAVVFAVLVFSWPRKRGVSLPQADQSRPNLASTAPPRPETLANPTSRETRGDRGYPVVQHRPAFAQRAVAGSHSARPGNPPSEPEVLVPPGQLQALLQFAADVRAGRVNSKQLIAAQKDVDKPIEIAPIKFRPIEIKPIEIAPQPDAPPQAAADSASP